MLAEIEDLQSPTEKLKEEGLQGTSCLVQQELTRSRIVTKSGGAGGAG